MQKLENQALLKIETLKTSPFFEHLVGGSSSCSKQNEEGLHAMNQVIRPGQSKL